ncbi:MAG: NAD(P)-dependent oxidoreductase [Candidatus Vogelbacteria bacterium]|nr:NAD(P)-dependent oxidoreductase [Candidatus Vogelbacteria bacterium]
MKVFITGISGFVGANLAHKLVEQGHEIHGLVRAQSKNSWRLESIRNQITIHEGDILDKAKVSEIITQVKPEIIYHLVVYGAYPFQKDAELALQTTVMATLHLLQAAKAAGVKMVVSTGSSSEYGTKDHPMHEDERVDPNSYYAVGKVAQTLLGQHFSNTEDLPVITLRLFSVYGPYEEPTRLLPVLILNALNNRDIPLASPDTARDFIYVDDIVDAIIQAGNRPDLGGQVFNLGSGKQQTLQTLVNTVMSETKSNSKLLWNTYPKRPFDTNIWVADTAKLKTDLKFEAKTPFAVGIKKNIDWFRNNQQFYAK